MARYIDADKALKKIKELQETDPATVGKKQFAEGFFCGLDEAEVVLLQAPTADVAEVKHGEWAWIAGDSPMCTRCGKVFDTNDNADAGITWMYCPNCGAKMDLRLCSDAECAPPCGDKSDCELYKNGYCGAKMDGGKAE